MLPRDFIDKWRHVELTERAAAQSHFIDLCRLLEEPDPITADPTGESYAFEKGALKSGGGDGWADVWKRGCFAWEYKGKRKNLDAAFVQLQQYRVALENPPLLIVSDMETFRVHTNWTNTVQEVHELRLEDLADASRRNVLKWAFRDPERLRPTKTRQTLTEEAAEKFANLALRLRRRGHDPQAVAHFVNRLVFCMFAEDVGLLPDRMFERMMELVKAKPADFEENASALFRAMKDGGKIGFERVEWFNGGLFDDDAAPALDKEEIAIVLSAARLDWSDIDPSILGTLFERGLDPDKRSQLGAHYTDRDKIMLIVNPVIVEPLSREWDEARTEIAALMEKVESAKSPSARTTARKAAAARHEAFIHRLRTFRILDPACGSGNFLYLSLLALKDLEHRANLEAEALGLQRRFPSVGPEAVRGIEINSYAAELARVSVWIGEIQWMRRNGFDASRDPILRPLDTIECRDALLSPDGAPAEWPEAHVVVGNPPFLGGKRLMTILGEAYVRQLFAAYDGQVRREADLVLYWFAKAGGLLKADKIDRFGLVATNSIRGGANRETLRISAEGCRIFDAWDDEEWTIEGAAVRVSLLCVDRNGSDTARLDGNPVALIFPDLTAQVAGAAAIDLTQASRLRENANVAFMGDTKGGAFDIPGDLARQWLRMPLNPNERPNSDVLRPWTNGMDVSRRPSDRWIIDFGWRMAEAEAALYEAPFAHCLAEVKPFREGDRRKPDAEAWWRHLRPRQSMWLALEGRKRYIATPTVSKHRFFVWLGSHACPDHQLIVVAREDDTTFGILHSRFHEIWALKLGTWLGAGNDPRYTPSTTFETFPFPEGLTPDIAPEAYANDPRAQAIAGAARDLTAKREAWLNPSDLVQWVAEVVPGFPDRPTARSAEAEAELRKRTLTKLYNARPQWLSDAHARLDAAVASAYGWRDDIPEDDVLMRLLALNRDRASVA